MAVLIESTLLGVHRQQFDARRALISVGAPRKGPLFQSSAEVGAGWRLIEFWESRADSMTPSDRSGI